MSALSASPKTFKKLLKKIPDLGEEAVKRTWRFVRATNKFTSNQKKKLTKTLKDRKNIRALRTRLFTIRRQLSNAGNRKTHRKKRKLHKKKSRSHK